MMRPTTLTRRTRHLVGLLLLMLTVRTIVCGHDVLAHGTAVVPPPEDCQVTPRTLAEVIAMTGAPVSANRSAADTDLFMMPPGQPVDEAVDQAIRTAVWTFVACVNTGDPLRLAALQSPAYLQRIVDRAGDPAAVFAQTPVAVYQRTALLNVTVVRQLDDSRVGALVHLDDPQDPRPEESVYLAFVEQNGRWLIDEMVEAPEHEGLPTGTATLRDGIGNEVGSATFTQVFGGLVTVAVTLDGIVGGGSGHAVHVHTSGDCSTGTGELFAAAGGPLNPQTPPGPQDPGDLGNIGTDTSGRGQYQVYAEGFTLSPGTATLFDADGSALVIHARVDDGSADPEGNSGPRIACGVITLTDAIGKEAGRSRTVLIQLILVGVVAVALGGAVIWKVRAKRRRRHHRRQRQPQRQR